MAHYPIETSGPTGLSLYAIIINDDPDSADFGKVWNTTLNAGAGGWEAYDSGHWAQYAVALTEYAGSGYYRGTFPANIEAALCSEVIYANATPTLGDAVYAGPGQSQGANVAAIAGVGGAAPKLARSATSMVLGTVIAGTLGVSAFTTDIENSETNAYKGRAIYFTTGDLAGQGGIISAFDPDTGLITIAGTFTAAPAADDVFVIS